MGCFRVVAVKGKGVESAWALAPRRVVHNHDANGWKPLLLAAKAGDGNLIEALLGAGVDADATEPVKTISALVIAKAEEHQDVVFGLKVYIIIQRASYK